AAAAEQARAAGILRPGQIDWNFRVLSVIGLTADVHHRAARRSLVDMRARRGHLFSRGWCGYRHIPPLRFLFTTTTMGRTSLASTFSFVSSTSSLTSARRP